MEIAAVGTAVSHNHEGRGQQLEKLLVAAVEQALKDGVRVDDSEAILAIKHKVIEEFNG